MMAFSSFAEFLYMGGHAPYVWSAWGVTALMLLGSVWHARLERRLLLRTLARRARREQRRQADEKPTSGVSAPKESVHES